MSDQGGTRIQLDIYHHLPIFTIIYHHLPSFTIIYHHLPSFTIIYHHLPSSTIIYHHLPSSTIIYHHLPSFTIIYHHLPSFTIIYHHLPSFTIIYHHLPSFTIISHHFPSFPYFTPYGWLNTKYDQALSPIALRLLVSCGTAEIDTELEGMAGKFSESDSGEDWLVVWNIFCFRIYIYVYIYYYILGIIIPTDELIFFRGVGITPTRKMFAHMLYPADMILVLFPWGLPARPCLRPPRRFV